MTALEDALREARAARITADQWLTRIRDGYKGKPYAYKTTAHYRAVKALEKAAKEGAPVPVPVPTPSPSPTPSSYYGPCLGAGLYVAWGLHNGALNEGGSFVSKVKQARAKGPVWVALAVGPQASEWDNAPRVKPLQDELGDAIPVGLWGIIPNPDDASAITLASGADFYASQAESTAEQEPNFAARFKAKAPAVYLTTVTNNDLREPTSWREHAPHLEAYLNENPNATPVRMHATFQTISGGPVKPPVPVVGIYAGARGDWSLADYIPWLDGGDGYRSFAVYLAEYLTGADWATFGDLAAKAAA